jgi:hypothetical protein
MNPLPIKPPFVFNNMSARIFPLRANLDALQHLCDGYLNIVPPEVGHFRASMPYVYLMVLDYGQVGEAVMRVGWFAQLEVFFSIPVEWYKLVDGQWTFHDWAVITPYIFVNDNFSVPLGRTVYGFPKILATLEPTPSHWVSDPLSPVTLARVETEVFPETYTGTGLEKRLFLEVERTTASPFRLPLDSSNPIALWNIVSHFANAIGGAGRDALWMMQSMRISPVNPGAYPGVIQQMLAKIAPGIAPGGPGFVQNSINLKQFRRADDPPHICYQALTNGRMVTTAFNGGGLLGGELLPFGDLSGGHTVKLYEHASYPIVRTLGLEVHSHSRSKDVNVAELRPVMPFWFDMDLRYEEGINLAWRSHDGIWKDDAGTPFDPNQKPAADDNLPEFNSVISTAIEAIAGPFQFSDTTIRVLPLLAKKEKLQEFLESYMNEPLGSPVLCTDDPPEPRGRILHEDGVTEEHVRLSVWAHPPTRISDHDEVGGDLAYVYLTAISFGGVKSKTNNVGDWAKYELSLMIPVNWQRKDHHTGHFKTIGVGVVPAYSFVDDCVGAISRLEVQGMQAMTANFLRPESVWLSTEGELSDDPLQTLLRVDAEVLPALGAGQKTTTQPVISISRGAADAGLGDAPDSPWNWAENLRSELAAKKATKVDYPEDLRIARALSLELLGNQTPFALYTLKQFRDVVDADKACYQSIERLGRELQQLFDIREIEDTLMVTFHDYPTLSIVSSLGILGVSDPDANPGIVYTTQAVRPFYIHATLTEPLSGRLMSRAGGMDWTIFPRAFETTLSQDKGEHGIMADLIAEELQDRMDPSRTAAVMFDARQRRETENYQPISRHAAVKALGRVDPQMVIDSILSREWGNNDPHAYWRRGQAELMKALSALPLEGRAKALAESELCREINNALALRPGAVAAPVSTLDLSPVNSPDGDDEPIVRTKIDPTLSKSGQRWQATIEEILERQRDFTEQRLRLEKSIDTLAPLFVLGFPALQNALRRAGQPAPTDEALIAAAAEFSDSLTKIHGLKIEGEPSERNTLDSQVRADKVRLGELLQVLDRVLVDSGSVAANVARAKAYGEIFREALDLARKFCDAQQRALMNKLSRGYQRPDFCVRRDSLGKDCDKWLPMPFSWDENWYYGRQFSPKLPLAELSPSGSSVEKTTASSNLNPAEPKPAQPGVSWEEAQ